MQISRAVGAFLRRDLRIALTYRLSFAGIIFTTFWGLVSFRFIAKLVHTGEFASSTTSYFAFVVVGLALGGVLEAGMGRPGAAARSDQVEGTLELVATQPLSPLGLGLGWSAYPLVEATVLGVITLLIAIPLGFRVADPNIAGAILILVMSALAFAGLGMISAALVLAVQQTVQITHFVVAFLGLLSGVVFPISLLPGWVQVISHLSPLTYAVNGLRGALLHGQSVLSIGGDLLVLAGFAIVLLPAGACAIQAGLRTARRRGSLSTY